MDDITRDPLPVSVIVLTYNEAANIKACLQSIAAWAGEIFVVDSGSTDSTCDIAARFTSNIVTHPFETYSTQRNWAQDSLPLRHDWVFHIDADERVSSELALAIREFLWSERANHVAGAMMTRRTVFLGRWIRHGGHYPTYHTRLFRRRLGRCEDRLYDQHFMVDGALSRLQGDLVDVLAADLDTWMARHMRWAGLEAKEQQRDGAGRGQISPRLRGNAIEKRRWLRSRLFGKCPLFLRGFLYFGYRYILRRGFLDGTEGLIFHFLHACWFRFYTDARIYELEHARMTDESL